MADQYRLLALAHGDPQRSVDYLIDTYIRGFGKPAPSIVEVDIDFKNSPVYSAVIVKEDGNVDIAIAKGLNFCWKRFVIAKEIFHGILDDDEYHNMDVYSHLESVLASFPDADQKASPSAESEFLAEVATMEFFFPFEKRVVEVQTPPELRNYQAMAQKYRIPLVKVERFLSDEYMNNLRAFA